MTEDQIVPEMAEQGLYTTHIPNSPLHASQTGEEFHGMDEEINPIILYSSE